MQDWFAGRDLLVVLVRLAMHSLNVPLEGCQNAHQDMRANPVGHAQCNLCVQCRLQMINLSFTLLFILFNLSCSIQTFSCNFDNVT